MNERIKELAEQASHQSPDGYTVIIPYSKDFAKKFAELIVRECAKMAGEQEFGDVWEGPIEDKIKHHFGVE